MNSWMNFFEHRPPPPPTHTQPPTCQRFTVGFTGFLPSFQRPVFRGAPTTWLVSDRVDTWGGPLSSRGLPLESTKTKGKTALKSAVHRGRGRTHPVNHTGTTEITNEKEKAKVVDGLRAFRGAALIAAPPEPFLGVQCFVVFGLWPSVFLSKSIEEYRRVSKARLASRVRSTITGRYLIELALEVALEALLLFGRHGDGLGQAGRRHLRLVRRPQRRRLDGRRRRRLLLLLLRRRRRRHLLGVLLLEVIEEQRPVLALARRTVGRLVSCHTQKSNRQTFPLESFRPFSDLSSMSAVRKYNLTILNNLYSSIYMLMMNESNGWQPESSWFCCRSQSGHKKNGRPSSTLSMGSLVVVRRTFHGGVGVLLAVAVDDHGAEVVAEVVVVDDAAVAQAVAAVAVRHQRPRRVFDHRPFDGAVAQQRPVVQVVDALP